LGDAFSGLKAAAPSPAAAASSRPTAVLVGELVNEYLVNKTPV
jgi:hypothetical protein